MISPASHSIARSGLDETFESEERRKTNLLLEARILRDQGEEDAAALRFAEAATAEERLSEVSAEHGLIEKSRVHRFSAASCWAAAGNFYDALTACNDLLSQADLPEPLRRAAAQYSDTIRTRRAAWHASLERENAEIEAGR
jgi:hypothetical protein